MPAPDPFASLSPGLTTASPVPPRNERRRSAASAAWRTWGWPLLGLLGGVTAAVATRLPLAVLPLVGPVTYAEDNAARAWAVLGCAALAGILCALRWYRPSLLCYGGTCGLLAASALEKYKAYWELRDSTHVPAGAGEMARQSAAMTATMLAGVRLEFGAFLLVAGCLLGIVAGFAGRRRSG